MLPESIAAAIYPGPSAPDDDDDDNDDDNDDDDDDDDDDECMIVLLLYCFSDFSDRDYVRRAYN